jgi:hypothetical protein
VKRIVLVACAALALVLLALSVRRAFASDETRIRSLVEGALADFNDRDPGDVLAAFAPDYRDATASVDREGLRAALLWTAARGLVKGAGPSLSAELGDEVQVADLDVEAGTATARMALRLLEERGPGNAVPIWDVAVEAGLVRDAEAGWRFVRSTHRTLSGAPPR